MKKRYRVNYWEKESVWVYRTITLPSEKNPKEMSDDELRQEIEQNEDVEFLDGDYNWETSDILDYDFKNDFKVEEEK